MPICDTQPKDPKVVTDALPISRFPVPHLADMPEDICNRILTVQEKSGFIPNGFLVLAHRPGRVPGLLRLPRLDRPARSKYP